MHYSLAELFHASTLSSNTVEQRRVLQIHADGSTPSRVYDVQAGKFDWQNKEAYYSGYLKGALL